MSGYPSVLAQTNHSYVRVDSLRSTRHLRVEIDGVLLAESRSPILLFETGLPTRYYVDRTDVDFTGLSPTETVSACPYQGTTGGYWSAEVGGAVHEDIAWTYAFTTTAVLPIAGLIAFYNEKVDLILDRTRLERPKTVFC